MIGSAEKTDKSTIVAVTALSQRIWLESFQVFDSQLVCTNKSLPFFWTSWAQYIHDMASFVSSTVCACWDLGRSAHTSYAGRTLPSRGDDWRGSYVFYSGITQLSKKYLNLPGIMSKRWMTRVIKSKETRQWYSHNVTQVLNLLLNLATRRQDRSRRLLYTVTATKKSSYRSD